jgi:hypothetical protein
MFVTFFFSEAKDGIAVLASNIRTTVDGILNIKHTKRLNVSNNWKEQRGSSNPRFALGVANETTTLVLDIDSCIFVIIFFMGLIQVGAVPLV